MWATAPLTVRGAAAPGRGAPGPLPIFLGWSLFRGRAAIVFRSDPADGRIGLTAARPRQPAKFSAPGEYTLPLQANDSSGDGGGGFQCCWTNAHVTVTVK
jgi:hypothetical protein